MLLSSRHDDAKCSLTSKLEDLKACALLNRSTNSVAVVQQGEFLVVGNSKDGRVSRNTEWGQNGLESGMLTERAVTGRWQAEWVEILVTVPQRFFLYTSVDTGKVVDTDDLSFVHRGGGEDRRSHLGWREKKGLSVVIERAAARLRLFIRLHLSLAVSVLLGGVNLSGLSQGALGFS